MPHTPELAPAISAALTTGRLWLAQFVYEDGSTFVHLCSSEEEAYQALADEDGLTVREGQTAEQCIAEHFADGDSDDTYTVAKVDSINL